MGDSKNRAWAAIADDLGRLEGAGVPLPDHCTVVVLVDGVGLAHRPPRETDPGHSSRCSTCNGSGVVVALTPSALADSDLGVGRCLYEQHVSGLHSLGQVCGMSDEAGPWLVLSAGLAALDRAETIVSSEDLMIDQCTRPSWEILQLDSAFERFVVELSHLQTQTDSPFPSERLGELAKAASSERERLRDLARSAQLRELTLSWFYQSRVAPRDRSDRALVMVPVAEREYCDPLAALQFTEAEAEGRRVVVVEQGLARQLGYDLDALNCYPYDRAVHTASTLETALGLWDSSGAGPLRAFDRAIEAALLVG